MTISAPCDLTTQLALNACLCKEQDFFPINLGGIRSYDKVCFRFMFRQENRTHTQFLTIFYKLHKNAICHDYFCALSTALLAHVQLGREGSSARWAIFY